MRAGGRVTGGVYRVRGVKGACYVFGLTTKPQIIFIAEQDPTARAFSYAHYDNCFITESLLRLLLQLPLLLQLRLRLNPWPGS